MIQRSRSAYTLTSAQNSSEIPEKRQKDLRRLVNNEHPMVLDCDELAYARHISGEGVPVLRGEEDVKCRIFVGP